VVLGSGGVLGFAWTIGALSALESEAGFDVRTVSLLVGTSAGSVASAMLACGVSVDEMRRHHQGVPGPTDPPIAFDYAADTGRALPPRPRLRPGSPRLLVDAVRHPRQVRAIVALAGALPGGRGTLDPVRRLVAEVADARGLGAGSLRPTGGGTAGSGAAGSGVAAVGGGATAWPEQPRTWIAATDYRSGRRVLFGRDRRVPLPDAVVASCAIPAWYPPAVIDGRPYIDGGAVSNASVDVLGGLDLDEVYVLAPMASVDADRPRSPVSRIERAIRRAITRGIVADVTSLQAAGVRTVLVTPGPEDLAVIGANLMNPRRRTQVLETSMRTSAVRLRTLLAARVPRAARASGQSPA
jgi:NTE family protein